MEQVAKATCILCKKLQRTRGGTWRFPRVSRAKSGILWLSGGTTRVRWCGASYQSPSMRTSCKMASGSMTRADILAAFPLSRRGSLGHLEVVQSSSHAGVLAARQLELRPHLVERLLEHVTCAPQCGASETAPPSRLRATPDAPNSSAMSSIFLFISAISASLSARACPLPRRSSSSSALA